jgi:hypothetical protein
MVYVAGCGGLVCSSLLPPLLQPPTPRPPALATAAMTTSHKPTYHPAIGRAHAGGYRFDVARKQFSSRALPAHLTLKVRADLTAASTATRDADALKAALLSAENKHAQAIRDGEEARTNLCLCQLPPACAAEVP